MSYLFEFSSAAIFSQTFLLSDDLDSFEEHSAAILWWPHYWKLSTAFLMIRLGLWVMGYIGLDKGGGGQQGKKLFSLYGIKEHILNITHRYWYGPRSVDWEVFVKFLSWKYILSVGFGSKSLQAGRIALHPEGGVSTSLIWNSATEICLVFSISDSLQWNTTDLYLFCALGYSVTYSYLVAQIIEALPTDL